MKIRCVECHFNNLENSEFCQECGNSLESKIKTSKVNSIYNEIETIEDVIFKPKKKGVSITNIIVGLFVAGCILVVGLVIVVVYYSDDTTQTDITTPSDPETFPLTYLNVADGEIIYDDDNESYFTGTLKNTYSKAARNVKVRLDFYYDEELNKQFDTRNAIVKNGAEANGAFSFKLPLTFYPQGQYWYVWKIESAEYGI